MDPLLENTPYLTREEHAMSTENQPEQTHDEPAPLPVDDHPAKRIYVGRRSSLTSSWSEHHGTFDEVVETMRRRALDGKANSEGFEVVEMTVARSVIVKPVITATEVTEQEV